MVIIMWDNICYLGTIKEIENDFGDIEKTIVYDDYIFCDERSVKYNEFYQAQALGMQPEIVLKVHQIDYNKQKYVKYEDEEYTILRTYKTSSEDIELTLTRGINVST